MKALGVWRQTELRDGVGMVRVESGSIGVNGEFDKDDQRRRVV